MKPRILVALAFSLAAGAGAADATDTARRADSGRQEYESNCAACHGISGTGDGPYAKNLSVMPSDLTTIAKRNNGVFPVLRLESMIDGRTQVELHGPRDMPVWGREYLMEAGTDWPVYMGVPFNPEVFVRARIMALVDYIARLQVK